MEDTHFPRPAQDRSLFKKNACNGFFVAMRSKYDPIHAPSMKLDNHNVRFVTYIVVGLLILCPRWWLPGFITSSSSSIFLVFTIKFAIETGC